MTKVINLKEYRERRNSANSDFKEEAEKINRDSTQETINQAADLIMRAATILEQLDQCPDPRLAWILRDCSESLLREPQERLTNMS